MVWQRFGNYLLNNQRSMLLIVLILSVLPVVSSLVAIIVALVTLRKGWQLGGAALIASLCPRVLVFLLGDLNVFLLLTALFSNVLIWVLALILRRSLSWAVVVQSAAGIGFLVLLLVHWIYPGITDWWLQNLTADVQQAQPLFGSSLPADFPARTARVATGIQLTAFSALSLLWLVLARWWQAVLFNPGQLQSELHNVRLSRSFVLAVAIVLLIALLSHNGIMLDVVPVLVLPAIAAGLSLMHYFAATKKYAIRWLVGFYIVIVVLFAYLVGILFAVGLVDSVMNLRARLNPKKHEV